jgi:TonB family protein
MMPAVSGRPGDAVLNSITARARTFTNADAAAVAVREGDFLITRASVGGNAPDVGARTRIQGSFTGLCLERGTALHCENSDDDERVDAAVCRALSTRSFIVVPVAGPASFLGVLAVFSSCAHSFTRTDIAVLKTMADQVAHVLATDPGERSRSSRRYEAPVSERPAPVDSNPDVKRDAAANDETAETLSADLSAAAEALVAPLEPASKPCKPNAQEVQPNSVLPQPLLDSALPQPSPEAALPEATVSDGAQAVSDRQAAKARVLQFPIAPPVQEEQLVSLAEAIEQTPMREQPEVLERELPTLYAQGGTWEVHDGARTFRPKWLAVGVLILALAAGGYWLLRRPRTLRPNIPTDAAPVSIPAPVAPLSEATSVPTTASSIEADAGTNVTPDAAAATPGGSRRSASEGDEVAPVRRDPSLADLKPPASARRIELSATPSPRQAMHGEAETAAPELTFAGAKPALPNARPTVPQRPKPMEAAAVMLEPSELVRKVAPRYPATGNGRPNETVLLHATVLKNGTIGEVSVVRGAAPFSAAAVAAVRQWLYKPARMNGTPMDSSVDVLVKFDRPAN